MIRTNILKIFKKYLVVLFYSLSLNPKHSQMKKFLFQISQNYVPRAVLTETIYAEIEYRVSSGLVWVIDIKLPYFVIEYIKSPEQLSNDIQIAADHNALSLGIYITHKPELV